MNPVEIHAEGQAAIAGITLAEFCRGLESYFGFGPFEIDPDDELAADLGFDSVMYVELVLMLEEAAGHTLSEQALDSLRTVDDVWLFFREMLLAAKL
jgi:acyl carrier protein